MKSERLLNAIGENDDELILEAMVMPSESQNPKQIRWIKYGALAACLCLLLVLPIAAASNNEMLVDIFADMTGWYIHSKEYYTDRDFSKEVRSLSKELAGEQTYLPMDSLEQTETFLGIAIPDNPRLSETIKDEVHIEVEVNGQRIRYDTPCLVYLAFDENGAVTAADANAAFRYGQMHLYVMYRIPTVDAVSKGGGGIGGIDANITETQSYITSSGRECAVIYTSTGDGIFSGYGYTVVDSILVELSLIGRSEEEIQQAMTEVLEEFA